MVRAKDSEKIFEMFVSMPYGKDDESKNYWNRFYHHAITGMKPLFEGRGYSLNFLRPKEMPSALKLKESVKELINRCDICLGVITGLNPNVFWELGYADSKGKPIILIVDEVVDEAEYSPVLIVEVLKEFYEGKMFHQDPPDGTRVLDFQERLLRYIDLGVNIVRGKKVPPPQYNIFSDRIEAQEPQIIINAKKTIDLITTNLSYYADFDEFVATFDGKEQYAFDPPVNKGVRVRILILDPESVITEYRAKQLGRGHEVAEYREELRQSAKKFYQRYIDKKNVDIRIYDDLPSQITMMVDDKVISSFVSRGQQARYNIHTVLDIEYKGTRATFEKHFAEVLAQEQTKHISFFSWAQK